MTKEQKPETTLKFAKTRLLSLINRFPQIIKPEIGIETFVDELNKASIKLTEYSHSEIFDLENVSQLIGVCPQIIRSDGIVEFIDDLNRAVKKYKEYFGEIEKPMKF